MDKGIIKMVIIVMAIAITLLLGGECLAMYSGSNMVKSSVDSIEQQQNQTSQDSEASTTTDSSSSTNQRSGGNH